MSDLICFLVTDFQGHYPVGTCAIAYARDREHCRRVLRRELHEHSLGRDDPDRWTITPITPAPSTASATVVLDGNY